MDIKKIVLPTLVALCMTTKVQATPVPVVAYNDLLVLKEQRVEELEEAEQSIQALNDELQKVRDAKAKAEQQAKERAKAQAMAKKSQQATKQVTRGGVSRGTFTITAYDDTPASQGQWVGQTATGFSLKGHTRASAMCIAVDPRVIPLNSKVLLEFDSDYAHFNGVYTAYDTGGAIKGNIIDLFMGGQDVAQQVRNFGRRKVKVTILE